MQSNTVHTTSSQQRNSALSPIAALVPHKGQKDEADNMNAHHGQTLYDKASSSIAHLSPSMQKEIVICKAILSTRLLQQRSSALSSIAAPVPQKVNKEESDNMNGTSWSYIVRQSFQLHRSSLAFSAKRDCDMQINTVHSTSSTTQIHAVFDCCPSATQRKRRRSRS